MKINYIVIFSASAAFAWMAIGFLTRYLREKLELATSPEYVALSRFISPDRLLSLRLFGALLVTCGMFVGQLSFGVERMAIAVPVACGFGIATWFLVLAWYRRKLRIRNEAFQSKVLDLTMGLANGMKSGLALGQALDALAKRMGDPMREEIMILLKETRLGIEFPEAFERLYKRMPCEDLHLLVTSVALTTKSGGSLVDVLDEMVGLIRSRTEFNERLKNMTAQGRFEALMISCAPVAAFFLLNFIDPALMRPLVTTGMGWLAVAGAAILVGIGYWVLRKLISIEV
jgi:Flp pilus assembly protein TadB